MIAILINTEDELSKLNAAYGINETVCPGIYVMQNEIPEPTTQDRNFLESIGYMMLIPA